ncbi:MAG: tetratricopeptide repeat protein [Candidatus Omnitrophica bacterium]|nr:tetratricopeptide repeat protein [Candidatus Omnitrophota bacterium]
MPMKLLLKRKVLCAALLALAALLAPRLEAAGPDAFEKANRLYTDGKFQEAKELYIQLSQEFKDDAAFLYNWGNSAYRLGQSGEAILAFERALKRDPRNADIRANLNHARSGLEYKIEDKRNWYLKAAEEALGYFRDQEINLLAMAAYSLFMAACLTGLLFRRGLPWGPWRKASAWFFAFSLLLAGIKYCDTAYFKDAVITSREAEVRYGPSVSDRTAFRLGEGLRAYQVDARRGWRRIVLVNNEGGWIKDSDLQLV